MFKSGQLSNFRRFFRFIKPHSKLGALGGLLMAIGVALQLPMPLLTMYLFDHVITRKDYSRLHEIGVVLIAFLLLRSVSGHFQTRVLTIFRNRVMLDVRRFLFHHIECLPLGFFSKTRTGYLVSRITTDEVLVRGLMSTDILAVIRELITLAVGIVLVFWLNWKLAAVAIAIVPFYAVWIVRLNPRVRAQTRQMQEDYSSSAGDMIETLTGIYMVKAFLAEQSELMKMLRSFRKALNSEFRLAMTSNILSIGAAMISSLGKVSLIWFGCWEIMKGQLTIGAFLAFNSFLQYLFEPTQNLLNLNTSAQQSLAAMDRIFELVDERSESRPDVESLDLRPVTGAVEFRDVSFAYDGNETVLRNVKLSVDGGSTVAIVGRSGAGKTTLVNLLMRFYDGYKGDILIDGQDIRTVSIESLRSHIGLVPQQPHLFADTVWNNLRYGCPDAGDDRLIECAKRANAHTFIQHLPDGYATKLGERGTTLSGGERQRISIAMAFLKDAPILILDEATSSVDSSAEKEIQQALERLAYRRTTFVIAHRLTTVRNADLIVVLDNGHVVETGRHDQLLNAGGIYSQLYADYFAPQLFDLEESDQSGLMLEPALERT